jgi:hypothetical protein
MKKLLLLILALSGCTVYQKVPPAASGMLLLDHITFQTGTIDLDLRGRDVLQQSFLGVFFNANDTANCEAVYFRPFNFQSSDSVRRLHAVQYMCLPAYPWSKLRREHPLVYEQPVQPVPDPNSWFHATIKVTKDSVLVWVNHSAQASLKVRRLGGPVGQCLGLFVDGMPGEFRRLRIKK